MTDKKRYDTCLHSVLPFKDLYLNEANPNLISGALPFLLFTTERLGLDGFSKFICTGAAAKLLHYFYSKKNVSLQNKTNKKLLLVIMRLDNLQENSLAYLERYVNNGSPSGYSIKSSTSDRTNPFKGDEFIHPYCCIADKTCFIELGTVPEIYQSCNSSESWIFVHPDMIDKGENSFFINKNLRLELANEIKLVPTASARTLMLSDTNCHGFFKLHYDGTIGRMERKLQFCQALSCIETSNIIISLINEGKLDSRLTLLPETGARVLKLEGQEWGMVWRDYSPYGDCRNVKYIIPVFSLFSKDRKNIHDNTLLEQIIIEKYYDPTTYVIDYLIIPIIECYFSLLKTAGIQPEWHAQNLMIGFDEDFYPRKFITRDVESMDKDLTLIKSFKLPFSFDSAPYHCIDESREDYSKRHSFMFDFKLGEYVIQPLLLFLQNVFFISSDTLTESIKECSSQQIKDLPDNYFPKEWFGYKNVKIDRSTNNRPYITFEKPKFRP